LFDEPQSNALADFDQRRLLLELRFAIGCLVLYLLFFLLLSLELSFRRYSPRQFLHIGFSPKYPEIDKKLFAGNEEQCCNVRRIAYQKFTNWSASAFPCRNAEFSPSSCRILSWSSLSRVTDAASDIFWHSMAGISFAVPVSGRIRPV
jgi:hypothetical protein